jgi:hypothetical protein
MMIFAGDEAATPTEGISKPLADVLKELGKRGPESAHPLAHK